VIRHSPFKAAIAMFAAIRAALALPGIGDRKDALGEINPYRSRGKGRGTPSRNWMRPYCNNGGKHYPHQGPQECLRRRVGGWAGKGYTKQQALDAIPAGAAPAGRREMDELMGLL
jgi:hypothetical protein